MAMSSRMWRAPSAMSAPPMSADGSTTMASAARGP